MRCSKTWRDESGDDSTAAAGRHPSPGRLPGERPAGLPACGLGALALGYKRLHVLLRREGHRVNHKLVYRLYREEGLLVPRRRRKRVAGPRVSLPTPTRPNERWGVDFIMDSLVEGRRFRCLTMVDEYTRECPVIEVDVSLPSARVLQILDRLAASRGLPASLIVDHGPEFISKALDAWAYRHGVQLVFIRPGKPADNAYIESFHGRLRDECLNESWFCDLPAARRQIEGGGGTTMRSGRTRVCATGRHGNSPRPSPTSG